MASVDEIHRGKRWVEGAVRQVAQELGFRLEIMDWAQSARGFADGTRTLIVDVGREMRRPFSDEQLADCAAESPQQDATRAALRDWLAPRRGV